MSDVQTTPQLGDQTPVAEPHEDPLARYDAAVNPILARFSGIGLITHIELKTFAGAIRQGLANLLGEEQPPITGESVDALGDQKRAQQGAPVVAADPDALVPSEDTTEAHDTSEDLVEEEQTV